MAIDMQDLCPVCNELSQHLVEQDRDWHHYKCPTCGRYEASFEACNAIEALKGNEKALISGVIRELNIGGTTPKILEATIPSLLERAPNNLVEKLDRLLNNLCQLTDSFGKQINLDDKMRSLGFAVNLKEFNALVNQLATEDLLKIELHGGQGIAAISVTAKGLQRIASGSTTSPNKSNKVFVAMSFHSAMDNVFRKAIAPGIEAAGYEVVRVDQLHFNNRIDDRIIDEIRTARFLVADFTNHRGGVYYEAGFAHGLGKEVIMCCSKLEEPGLHFDTNHFNHIFYEDLKTFSQDLTKRILATMGPGLKYSNS